jgi:hypothetical protein
MIKKHIKTHGHYHISLLLILILGSILAYYSRDNKQFEMMILVGLSFLYVLWGVFHHYTIHDLTPKIVVEYTIMASLGLVVALFLIKGFML